MPEEPPVIRIEADKGDETKTSEPPDQPPAEKDGETGAEEEPFEARLAVWEQMPDGCLVIPGHVGEKWKGWQMLR